MGLLSLGLGHGCKSIYATTASALASIQLTARCVVPFAAGELTVRNACPSRRIERQKPQRMLRHACIEQAAGEVSQQADFRGAPGAEECLKFGCMNLQSRPRCFRRRELIRDFVDYPPVTLIWRATAGRWCRRSMTKSWPLGLRAMAASMAANNGSLASEARSGLRKSAASSWPRHMYSVPVQVTRTRLQDSQKLWVRGVMKPSGPT